MVVQRVCKGAQEEYVTSLAQSNNVNPVLRWLLRKKIRTSEPVMHDGTQPPGVNDINNFVRHDA